MKSDREIVDAALELARQFYLAHGYVQDKGFKFYDSEHPQEQGMWNLAVLAYDYIKGTDVEQSLDNILDGDEVPDE